MTFDDVFHFGSKDLDKFFIGSNNPFTRVNKIYDEVQKSSYPPYNIKRLGDDKFSIELAVAGFTQSDIDIEVVPEENKLVVSGKSDDNSSDYLHRGIANRAFTRSFALDEHVEVRSADLSNGMLIINLERIVPEHKKPRKIKVNDAIEHSSKQLLTEDKNAENKSKEKVA